MRVDQPLAKINKTVIEISICAAVGLSTKSLQCRAEQCLQICKDYSPTAPDASDLKPLTVTERLICVKMIKRLQFVAFSFFTKIFLEYA